MTKNCVGQVKDGGIWDLAIFYKKVKLFKYKKYVKKRGNIKVLMRWPGTFQYE